MRTLLGIFRSLAPHASAIALVARVASFAVPTLAQAATEGPDTMGVRLEVGASTDVTNEQFYEDAFVDSIALGRRIVSSPETWVAGVVFASLTGTRGLQATQYQIDNELSLGDKTRRNVFGATWRSQLSPEWRLHLAPRLEYRHDKTFDRDLEEFRGSLSSRVRRSLGLMEETFAELGTTGEFLRSSGQGADFLLDRNAGKVSVAVDRTPLLGSEWRVGYSLAAREFPDSSERNHFEHGWEGRWKHDFEGRGSVAIETDGARRVTMEPPPTSRDQFWDLQGAVEGELRPSINGSVRARVAVEALQYDQEDTTVFFNYQIVRARVMPRLERNSWSVSLGPRGEILTSRSEPSEEYREAGGALEVEFAGAGAWWSLTPAGGWRDYTDSTQDGAALHSSYAFYELGVLGDQPIPGGMRLRLFGSGRYESHVDPSHDARSLYFSIDLRRSF